MIKNILIGFIFFLVISSLNAQALQLKPKQLFISPVFSVGTSLILNQNNYGFSDLAYKLKVSGTMGVLVGWDYYLKQSYTTGILISKWGQNYDDILSRIHVQKKVSNTYIQIPFQYKHVFGRKRGYDHEVFSPYVYGIAQIGYLLTSNVEWIRATEEGSDILVEIGLIDFVTYRDWNANADEIIAQGEPEKDKHFFSPIDINLGGGAGFQYFITRKIMLFTDINIMMGINDMNAKEWRFKDKKNAYRASYNINGGLRLGANFYL